MYKLSHLYLLKLFEEMNKRITVFCVLKNILKQLDTICFLFGQSDLV